MVAGMGRDPLSICLTDVEMGPGLGQESHGLLTCSRYNLLKVKATHWIYSHSLPSFP